MNWNPRKQINEASDAQLCQDKFAAAGFSNDQQNFGGTMAKFDSFKSGKISTKWEQTITFGPAQGA